MDRERFENALELMAYVLFGALAGVLTVLAIYYTAKAGAAGL